MPPGPPRPGGLQGASPKVPPLPRVLFVPAASASHPPSAALGAALTASGLPPKPPTAAQTEAMRRTGGLFNTGTDCFFNAILQVLANTPELVSAVQLMPPASAQVKDAIDVLRETAVLMRQRKVYDARALLRLVQQTSKGSLRRNRQEDAHEALRVLLETLQRACLVRMGKPPECVDAKFAESTMVHKIFGGRLTCETKCPQCKHTSERHESFLDLSLELRRPCKSVSDALQRFQAKETLDKDNLWLCDGCRAKVPATRRLVVSRSPPVLMVHLKRFSMRMDGTRKKLADPVDLDQGRLSINGEDFELRAVVIHSGWSVNGGHYHALCKVDGQAWLEYDDEIVRPIRANKVLQEQQGYLLVYHKLTPTSITAMSMPSFSVPPPPPPQPLPLPPPSSASLPLKHSPLEAQSTPPPVILPPVPPPVNPSVSAALTPSPRSRTRGLIASRFWSARWSRLFPSSSRKSRKSPYRLPSVGPKLSEYIMAKLSAKKAKRFSPRGLNGEVTPPPSSSAFERSHGSNGSNGGLGQQAYSFDQPISKPFKHRFDSEYDAWDAALDAGKRKKAKNANVV